jgi:AmiR/NasT family two-component response regulator
MKIVAAIHDLMFSSKVNAAAQGKPISWVPRGTPPAEHVAKEGADVLLIDLDARHFDAIAAVRAVKQASPGVVVIGYVGHEKTDVIEAAKAAGADRVLAKGEFARRLPELLQG